MTAKELKFLELFEEFVQIDIVTDKLNLSKKIKNFMDFDYNLSINLWEYLSTTREPLIIKDDKYSLVIGFEILNLFYAKGDVKCLKVVADNPGIRRAIYQYSQKAGEEKALAMVVELLVANKLIPAEEIFKCLAKNTRIHFGQTMKRILERVFIELLKKNPSKIILNKKLADVFVVYIKKIKTEERAMQEQRIKETR